MTGDYQFTEIITLWHQLESFAGFLCFKLGFIVGKSFCLFACLLISSE